MRSKVYWMLGTLALLGAVWAANPYVVKVPKDFPPMPIPEDNPMTAEKVELGRKLFYDPRLSSDNKIACASCHKQQFAFSDGGKAVSLGVAGRKGTRNAPGLANVGYRKSLFWEGGAPRLELQAVGPITHPDEMNMDPPKLVAKLQKIPEYASFKKVFEGGLSMLNITKALAAFQRTLISADTPWDRFNAGDKNALSESALRGLDLFFTETADCFHCHVGHNMTNEDFANTALYTVYKDQGLARITKKDEDVGKFKTPSLRNIELTAPYMHDGSIKTLRDAVKHYNDGGQPNLNADVLVRPLGMTDAQIDDLVEFMKSFTDRNFVKDPRYGPPKK